MTNDEVNRRIAELRLKMEEYMEVQILVCPLVEKKPKTGPITSTFYSQYQLTDEEIRLFDMISPLPKPSIDVRRGRTKKSSKGR